MSKSRVNTSKALSWLLRHGADKEGLTLCPGGWAKVSDILEKPNFKKVTVAELKELVAECPKQRFKLKENENGELYIKANQGHSIQVEEPELAEITSGEDYEFVIHGTYYKSWESIKKQGLNRMNRTHIHFAPGLPGETEVISGMRNSCQIYIYIDLPKALQAGFKFYKSDNNVILCSGNETGYLPAEYFLKVIDKKSGKQLM